MSMRLIENLTTGRTHSLRRGSDNIYHIVLLALMKSRARETRTLIDEEILNPLDSEIDPIYEAREAFLEEDNRLAGGIKEFERSMPEKNS